MAREFMQEPKLLKSTKSLIHVIFDVETTSLDLHHAEIIQVSAACGDNAPFNIYITPKGPITARKSRFSKMEDGTLCLDGQPVKPERSVKEALQKFIFWLQLFHGEVVLLAHNAQKFDALHLVKHLMEQDLLADFQTNVVGFIDTLIVFKNHFSLDKTSTGLKFLVETILRDFQYGAHDSSEDVRALKELLDKTSAVIGEKLFDDASSSLAYEIAHVEDLQEKNENYETLLPIYCISKYMRQKIAGVGLRYHDLQLAFQTAGRDGIESVLSQSTKSQEIISQINEHFSGEVL